MKNLPKPKLIGSWLAGIKDRIQLGGYYQEGEFTKLYISIAIRSIALSAAGIFFPVLLYNHGFSITHILMFYVGVFTVSTLCSHLSGWLVIKLGPKLILLLSNFGYIASILLLMQTQGEVLASLIAPIVVYGLSRKLFFLAYNSHFAYIINVGGGGRQLGFITNLTSVTSAIGPVIGGLIGFLLGEDYIMIFGVIVLFIAAIPLFVGYKPEALPGGIRLKGLHSSKHLPSYLSMAAYAAQARVWQDIWPLFLAVAVFINSPHLAIGGVTTLGMVIGLLFNSKAGKSVDRGRGGLLLKLSTTGLALTSLARPLASNLASVAGINLLGQPLLNATSIPYFHGLYDTAKGLDLNRQRISYIANMEVAADAGSAILLATMLVIASLIDGLSAIKIGFVLAGVITLLVMTHRFKSLGPNFTPKR